MFEQVGEAGPPRLLVLRSHVESEVDGCHRKTSVFVNDDPQAIIEDVPRKRDVHKNGQETSILPANGETFSTDWFSRLRRTLTET